MIGRVRDARLLVCAGALVAVVASCAAPTGPPAGPGIPPAELRIQVGIEQVYVTGAAPGEEVRVVGPIGDPASSTRSAIADAFGSVAVRELLEGEDYLVEHPASDTAETVTVRTADDPPDPSFYLATVLKEGLNYLPTRDGTLLAAVVRPPLGRRLTDGPFPTVIEYSGYQVAAPADPIADRIAGLLDQPQVDRRLLPDGATAIGSELVRLAGYATVSLQLRGTGCSGGEADLFDLPSAADGYDAVETIAAQSWVAGGRVGMVGISFSGFSQLAVAATRPPSLAAIAPFSFAGRLWDVGWPGGVRNVGFAEGWLAERQESARPAPGPGALPYANALVPVDPYCTYNQNLRLQTRNAIELFRTQFTRTELYDRRDFVTDMAQVDVPVFGALQFQDEQTSSYAMLGLDRLTPRNPRVWMSLSNGTHVDAISPDTLIDLFQFLDLYVAQRSPELKLVLYALQGDIFGQDAAPLPFPSLFGRPYHEARAMWEAQPTFRYGLERVTGGTSGATGSRWSFRSSSFPPASTTAQQWYLGPGGTLGADTPVTGSASWVADPSKRPATSSRTSWSQVPAGYGLGFTSAPVTGDVAVVGPVAADLWVASTAPDTDLQVTISEVRSDGKEMFVSSGVQRASQRTLDTAADTALVPALTFTDPQPLEPGVNLVRVQVLPIAHVFRAGSRIRVTVGPTGGDKEAWRYASVDQTTKPTNTLSLGGTTASSITLPVVAGVTAPTGLPPCPLSGQPCRTFTPAANGG